MFFKKEYSTESKHYNVFKSGWASNWSNILALNGNLERSNCNMSGNWSFVLLDMRTQLFPGVLSCCYDLEHVIRLYSENRSHASELLHYRKQLLIALLNTLLFSFQFFLLVKNLFLWKKPEKKIFVNYRTTPQIILYFCNPPFSHCGTQGGVHRDPRGHSNPSKCWPYTGPNPIGCCAPLTLYSGGSACFVAVAKVGTLFSVAGLPHTSGDQPWPCTTGQWTPVHVCLINTDGWW